ncbi:kinase-like domain-containing protein [Rhizophagus diaphanus]|nr:kinase-like domain-containing protein [Rhizophagus diaphanus] [Rhizophagus sp. MUCL 43196]
MLVMNSMDVSLREFLQKNHNQLSWKEKFQIVVDMTHSLYIIHEENAIHRDLHSGNILHSPRSNKWYINELGLSGPADISSKSIYGNLPYIAPEVIAGKQVTKASNIYGIAMLMWEISSGQPPFTNREHDYNLANDIVNGMRPNIIPGTPSEYESLMKQSWDADPLKRPDAYTLWKKFYEINLYYLNELYEAIQSEEASSNVNKNSANYTDGNLHTSKVYQFENLPEPRNATEEEQEAFHNKSYDNSDNIDFNKTNNQDEDIRNKTIQQQIKDNIDENEVYVNPNLHSEEQDELEIPDSI